MSSEPDKKRQRDSLRSQLDRLGAGDRKRPAFFSADEVRRAIRKRKQTEQAAARKKEIVYRRDVPRTDPPRSRPLAPDQRVALEEAIDGVEEIFEGRGKFFTVLTRAAECEELAQVGARLRAALEHGDPGLLQRLEPVCGGARLTPADLVFMDVESTGLGSSPLFLVGVMVWENDGLEVRQYLARHYAEEPAVIAVFMDLCRSRRLLVTFNGKSFDFPFIRARAAANGLAFNLAPAHLDLLHVCRRIWKSELPDCRLQTLESRICRRLRHGDIPGCEIPDAYHAYVRTENAWQIVEILKHNRLDLVTLADLMTRFPGPQDS